jgi:outer membrane protein assembly factor BamB
MRNGFCPVNRLAALAVVGIALATLGVQAAEPPSPESSEAPLLVSARSLGSVGGSIRSETFADALKGFRMLAISSPGRVPADWRTPPVNAGSSPWVSVVTAGFGGTAGPEDQAEAYAFLFDTPGGPLKRLGHVSYRQTYDSNATSWNWIPPTDRLAAAVQAAFAHAAITDRPLLGLRVEVGKQASGGSPTEGGLMAAGEDFMQTSMGTTGRPVLEAMAWAAAFEAGWAPSLKTGPADASAVLEIYFGHKACSLRLTLKTASGEKVSVKREVPENRYHAHLRRMFLGLRQGAFFSDFLSFRDQASQLVSVAPGRLLFLSGAGLKAFDTATCQLAWPETTAGKGQAFALRKDAAGAAQVIRYRPSLAVVSASDGSARVLAPVAAAHRGAFDVNEGQVVASAGTNLFFYNAASLRWQAAERGMIACGPAILGNRVIAGTDDGVFFALDSSDGKSLWRVNLEPGLAGTLVGAGGSVLVFSRNTESLLAVEAASGRRLWQVPLGDVLVRPPLSSPAGLLLATKSNRVLLLDPQTGGVRAERRLPNWISDILWIDGTGGKTGGAIACLTLDGGLFVLNPADLAIRIRYELGARAGGPMLVAEAFPTLWTGPLDPEDIGAQMDQDRGTRQPCLLVSDDEGFAYIVPLHKLLE